MRRPSVPTLAVWAGVVLVLVMSVALMRDLARATRQSEQAAVSGRISEAFRVAQDAHSRQDTALLHNKFRDHAEASQDLRRAVERVTDLDASRRPEVEAPLADLRAYLRAAWAMLAENSGDANLTRQRSELLERGSRVIATRRHGTRSRSPSRPTPPSSA